jgi:hypothetical protein
LNARSENQVGPCRSLTRGLIAGRYADPEITAVLDRLCVPRRPAGGDITERFPEPVPITRELLHGRYEFAGCSSGQIELLTGQSQVVVRSTLGLSGIPSTDSMLCSLSLPCERRELPADTSSPRASSR